MIGGLRLVVVETAKPTPLAGHESASPFEELPASERAGSCRMTGALTTKIEFEAAFNQALLKRFVNLMGLFPVGNLVRLSKGELAVVTAEHPSDPFRPQVKIIVDRSGETLETPLLANTWEHDSRGEHPYAVVEAVDPESSDIDPLKYL
jgi:hypothetical protein